MRSSSAGTVVCDTVDEIAMCVVFEIFAAVCELATRCL